MKTFKFLFCFLAGLAISNVALAKTEQVTLKKNLILSGEAIIFPTTKGEVILNACFSTVSKIYLLYLFLPFLHCTDIMPVFTL